MALQQDLLIEKFNSVFPNVYIKFSYLRWSSTDNLMYAQFSVWATPTSEEEGSEALTLLEIDMTTKFPGIQALVYSELKKLPEYIDGIDV